MDMRKTHYTSSLYWDVQICLLCSGHDAHVGKFSTKKFRTVVNYYLHLGIYNCDTLCAYKKRNK